MEAHRCPSEIMTYLGSFWRRVREQNTKTAQRIEHAYAEFPAELAAGWKPTESGTGRLATGGKALVSSPGKMRTTSAPADLQREKQNYYPSSIWANLTEAYENGFLSNETKRLLPATTPEPNQTFFSNLLPLKSMFHNNEDYLNKFRGIVSPELPLVSTNTCAASYATQPSTINKRYFDFLRLQYSNNSIASKNHERYKDGDHDQFTQYVKSYTCNSMLDLRE